MNTIQDYMRDCVLDIIADAKEAKLLTISDKEDDQTEYKRIIEYQLEIYAFQISKLLEKVTGI